MDERDYKRILSAIWVVINIIAIVIVVIVSLAKWLGGFQLSTVENILVALLGLLAVERTLERFGILSTLDVNIKKLMEPRQYIRTKSQLPPIQDRMEGVSEIWMLLATGGSLISGENALNVFLERLRSNNCEIRIVLVEPRPDILKSIEQTVGYPVEYEIKHALQTIKDHYLKANPAKCHVRFVDILLPYAIIFADPQTHRGSLSIGIQHHKFMNQQEDRPQLFLIREENPYWHDHFKQIFESVWEKTASSQWDGKKYLNSEAST